MRIFESAVLCFNEGNENLGEQDVEMWLPVAIDLDKVCAIKSNGDDGEKTKFCGINRAVLYVSPSDYFIVRHTYEEAIKLWKQ